MRGLWIGALLLLGAVLAGCSDPEALQVAKMLNDDPRVKACDAHVKNVEFTNTYRDAVMGFQADVLDADGKVVGKATGRRVEGFATMKPRIEWTDEAMNKKAREARGESPNKALREKVMKADADGDGKVTYEEALAANPHMLQSAFHYLDRNGDGVVSAEDETYKGPVKRWRPFSGAASPR